MQKHLPFLLVATTGSLLAAEDSTCKLPEPPVACYSSSDCAKCTYCLGPTNVQGNSPVRPYTCNGDYTLTIAGFYWKAHQDGLEYIVDNSVVVTAVIDPEALEQINNLVDAEYNTTQFKWEFGGKAGLSYSSPCDGWDIGFVWTYYRGRGHAHQEADIGDNHTLVTLWSAYNGILGAPVYASDVQSHWKLKLNLIDVELGREFWTSKYVTFRPHVGLRGGWINQRFEIDHKGGTWNSLFLAAPTLNNTVELKNNFKGIGLRAGFDLVWNFGCGWGLYNNFAASIVYGRFNVRHHDQNRFANSPFTTQDLLETENRFRSSRAMLDLGLGLQWFTKFCECKYVFTAKFGWEQHLFFNQNQLWRVERKATSPQAIVIPFDPNSLNNNGNNLFQECRGDLDTQGWTLTFKFDF